MKRINSKAISIAKELGYDVRIPDICTRLANAASEIEIERIMVDARHYMSDLERARMARS